MATTSTGKKTADLLERIVREHDPNETPPAAAALADWINSGACPTDALTDAAVLLIPLLDELQPLTHLERFIGTKGSGGTFSLALSRLALYPCGNVFLVVNLAVTLKRSPPVELPLTVPIGDVVQAWNDRPEKDRSDKGLRSFPLSPIVAAWIRRPRLVQPNARAQNRILPGKLAQAHPTDSRAGKQFSPAVHISGDQQFVLGFEDQGRTGPALPIALYDLGVDHQSAGKGAPLALRIFVESILAVEMAERNRGQPVAMEIPLRELLGWLYPGRRPSPAEYWPRLMAAVEALDSRDARIPLVDPETGRGELRRIVSVGGIPRGPDALDDVVRIVVDLPAGSGNGPQVSGKLRDWGTRSAPAYRLLLNLPYRWHAPGKTVIPVGPGRRRFWTPSLDPQRYEPVTDTELVDLAFPTSSATNRRVALSRARQVLTELEKAGELRIVDGRRILPPVKNDDRR